MQKKTLSITIKAILVFFTALPIFMSGMPLDLSGEKRSEIVDKLYLAMNGKMTVDNFYFGKYTEAAFNERTETNAQGSSISSPYDVTLNVPAGTANGDLMFTWIGSRSATVTTNAAWTLLGSYTVSTEKWYLFARVANNEPVSYVWNFSASSKYKATCTTYIASSDFNVTNVSTDITVSNVHYATNNTVNRAASFNVPNANSVLLFFGGVYATASRTQTGPAVPGNFVEDYDAGHTTPDFWLQIANYIWSGSGATGNIDSTISSTALTTKHAFAVALKPPSASPPTVTTQAASGVEAATATCNGDITATGGANATARGCEWNTDSGAPYANSASDSGSYGAGAFTKVLAGLPPGTTIYARAFATNPAGTSYGGEVSFLTKPATPTNVAATDGSHTDKVAVTWTKSTGATGYRVYRDAVDVSGLLGDVATYDDTGAAAPTITPGTASATDGSSTSQVDLSVSGASANNGTTHTYKVVAVNATGNSADSITDTGYRGVGSLTYQWQVSAADSNGSYSNIAGATTASYGYVSAPAGTVTPGTASATDGSATDKITLSISGASANPGAGRYYKVVLNAAGAAQQIANADRGHRGVGPLTYQWRRSSGDSDASYSDLGGAVTASHDDSTAPAPTITVGTVTASDGTSSDYVVLNISGEAVNPGAGRYFYATVNATGAVSQNTNHDRGYIGVGPLTYQWQRSAGDSDASYSDIDGATAASYNDIGAPPNGNGRYYEVILNAAGAAQQTSAADRGYRLFVPVMFSGTAYQSEGGSSVGAGVSVKVYANGSTLVGATSTDANGLFSVVASEAPANGGSLLIYIDNHATYKANTVIIASGTSQSNLHLYVGTLS